ncbi:MAG: hypothetical protein QM781_16410 [Chitinophagaceae bacterium]
MWPLLLILPLLSCLNIGDKARQVWKSVDCKNQYQIEIYKNKSAIDTIRLRGRYYIDEKNYLDIEGAGNNIQTSDSSIKFLVVYNSIKQHFSEPDKMSGRDMEAFYQVALPYNLHCIRMNDSTMRVVMTSKAALSGFEECFYRQQAAKK